MPANITDRHKPEDIIQTNTVNEGNHHENNTQRDPIEEQHTPPLVKPAC